MDPWWYTLLKALIPRGYYKNTTFSLQVNRHMRVYLSRSLDRNNVITANSSVTKHSRAARTEYAQAEIA
ncbi:hypothetical protein S40285_09697 [Stachybotrys chlorohalonatus IBT 40285]|uniref:Uncharacterized protein n=1 Tax=Stachybotrys chlorohalonatus (strain IBT 40285) TaxID=1283841 RepID=A0A084R201_STAC4|nr:hypothetical protein S40285_09697 [Stachybotrys chlorohalonata IBT 40285]